MAQWTVLKMSSDRITTLHVKGFISVAEAYEWRIPDDRHLPSPWPDEVVSLAAFRERGLGLPMHPIGVVLLPTSKFEMWLSLEAGITSTQRFLEIQAVGA
jgi:hypothetical protein